MGEKPGSHCSTRIVLGNNVSVHLEKSSSLTTFRKLTLRCLLIFKFINSLHFEMTEKQNGNGNTNCAHTGILKKEKSQDPIGKKKDQTLTNPNC